MRFKLFHLIFAIIFLNCNWIKAEPKIKFRINLQKGAIYEMCTKNSQTIEYEKNGENRQDIKKSEITALCKVIENIGDSSFVMDYSFVRMKIHIKDLFQEFDLDSDIQDENNKFYEEFKQLPSIKLQINSRGGVDNLEGLDELVQKMKPEKKTTQVMKYFLDEKNLKSLELNYFPYKEIGIGDKWTNSNKFPEFSDEELTIYFEVVAIDEKNITLSSNIEIAMEIKQIQMTGSSCESMIIDRTDGFVRNTETISKYISKSPMMKDENGKEIPLNISSVRLTSVKKL
jgi:hypothetical protein